MILNNKIILSGENTEVRQGNNTVLSCMLEGQEKKKEKDRLWLM